jgi:hypothetical protein
MSQTEAQRKYRELQDKFDAVIGRKGEYQSFTQEQTSEYLQYLKPRLCFWEMQVSIEAIVLRSGDYKALTNEQAKDLLDPLRLEQQNYKSVPFAAPVAPVTPLTYIYIYLFYLYKNTHSTYCSTYSSTPRTNY